MTPSSSAGLQRTALVTGATNGIGKVTALELARRGYRVLFTARDETKGQRILAELRAESSNDALELFVGDLSSMAEVRRIALEVRTRHPKLDVLVNNVGGVFAERKITVDGFEYTFALNHLSYFLLTNLLMEPLRASGNARVVSVSSSGNRMARMRWDDLEFSSSKSGWAAYPQSKLMNVLFANALARLLCGTGVTSNSLHPGVVNSGFGKNATGLNRLISRAVNVLFVATTPEKGAETGVYLATSPEVEGVNGQYFANKKVSRANPIAYDVGSQERLWRLSEERLSWWLDPVDAGQAVAHR